MDPLIFYFDRCFGTRFPDALRRANPPFEVLYQHDKTSRFRFHHSMPDDEWLMIAGQNNWIVFSHDRKWHREEAECFAVKQHGVGCFYLWGGQAKTWEKFKCFMRAHRNIIEAARATPRPFVYEVSESGRLKKMKL